jgi:hypothetical protein
VIGNAADAVEYAPEPIIGGGSSSSGSYSSDSILQGILSSGSTSPKIFAFNDENTIRAYQGNLAYTQPAIAQDIDSKQWFHLAFINQGKYSKLYVEGELRDKVKNADMNWDSTLTIGAAITNFQGYITGFRVTYGVSRYNGVEFSPPQLPLPKN